MKLVVNSELNVHGEFRYPELTFCGLCMHGDGIGGGGVLSDVMMFLHLLLCPLNDHSSCISRFPVILTSKRHLIPLENAGNRPADRSIPVSLWSRDFVRVTDRSIGDSKATVFPDLPGNL